MTISSRIATRAALGLVVLAAGLASCERERAPAPAVAPSVAPAEQPLSGIGIRPILHEHGFAVGQVFPGSPAERAGLRVGDVVIGVDQESTARWTLDRVAQRLRGPSGSKVTLELERGGAPMPMTLTRGVLTVPEVPR